MSIKVQGSGFYGKIRYARLSLTEYTEGSEGFAKNIYVILSVVSEGSVW